MSATDVPVPSGPELSDYLALLRRRGVLIVAVVLAVVAAAAAWSFTREPVYEGSTEVLVQPIRQDPFDGGARIDQLVSPETEVRIVLSGAVAERVREAVGSPRRVGGLLGRTEVTVPRGTQVLRIVHADEDPNVAVEVARAFAEQYLQFRAAQARATVDGQVAALETELEELNAELAAVVNVIADDQARPGDLAAAAARQRVLTDRIARAESEVADKAAFAISAGEIIDFGVVPDEPASPDHARNLAAGGFLGLLLGLAAAFVVDGIDPRISRAGEVEQLTGVAVLSDIPAGRRGSVTGPQRDAYRRLALVLRSATVTRDVLLVASATNLQERRATAVRLAEALSRMGASVLLIDADVRKPGLHDELGVPNGVGLVDVVTGVVDIDDATIRVDDAQGLHLLTAGRLGDRPPTLLEDHPTAPTLIARARSVYDVVIVDAPAIYDASDALSLQREVDGVLLVAKHRTTTRAALEEAQVQFDTVGAKLIGVVLHRGVARRR